MSEHEYSPQPEAQKEYSFDEGVDVSIEKIKALLETQDEVVVCITGSGTGVGKTYLDGALGKKLTDLGIANIALANDYFLDVYAQRLLDQEDKRYKGRKKAVIILTAGGTFGDHGGRGMEISDAKMTEIKEREDTSLRQAAQKAGLKLEKIDLRIFIYRTDKIFGKDALRGADIIIKNEKAKDDR